MAEGQTNGTKARDIEFFGGASRFELELEFVQSLSNPLYLQHLAAQKYLEDADFVRYIEYLHYFAEPEYIKFLQYPGPTLRALELLQQEDFRRAIISPQLVDSMVREGFEAATAGLGR